MTQVSVSSGVDTIASGKRMVVRNVASSWLLLVSQTAASLLIIPFLIAHFGQTAYGVWATLAGLLGFLMLLDMGVTSAVDRYVAKYRALGAMAEVNACVSSAVTFLLLAGVSLSLIGVVGARPFINFFGNVPGELRNDAVLLIQLMCVGVGVRLLQGPFRGLLTGWQRHYLASVAGILMLAVRVLLTFGLVLYWRAAIYVPITAFCLANVLGLAALIVFGRTLHPSLPVFRLGFDRTLTPQLLGLGGQAGITMVCTMLFYQGPNFLLMKFFSPDVVTPFSIAMLLILTCAQATHVISGVFTPLVSSVDAAQGEEEVARLALRACRLVAIFSTGLCLGLLVLGRPFIDVWLHGETPGAFIPLAVLAVAHVFEWPNAIIKATLIGTSQLGVFAVGWAATSTVGVLLALVFVPHSETPLLTMALIMAVLLVLLNTVYIPLLFKRSYGVPLLRFHRDVHLRPLLVAIPLGLAAYVLLRMSPFGGWAHLLLATAVLGATYLCGAYWLGMDSEMRRSTRLMFGLGRGGRVADAR